MYCIVEYGLAFGNECVLNCFYQIGDDPQKKQYWQLAMYAGSMLQNKFFDETHSSRDLL